MPGIDQTNLPPPVTPGPASTLSPGLLVVPPPSWWLRHRLTCHLIYAVALLSVAGLPASWVAHVVPGATPTGCLVVGWAAYLIFWTAWSRNPELGLLGSIASGALILAVLFHRPNAAQWALQSGLVFLLVHSLRWHDPEHPGASTTRALAGLAWVVQSFAWMNTDTGQFWMPLLPAAAVLGIYCAWLPARGIWRLFLVPAAALLVMGSGPGNAIVESLRLGPASLVALVATFLGLGAAGIVALTREMWHEQ